MSVSPNPLARPRATPALSRAALDSFARGLSSLVLVAAFFIAFKLFNGADTPFLGFAAAGIALAHFLDRPSWRETAVTLLLAAAIAWWYASSGGKFGDWFGASIVPVFAFLGLSSSLVLGWRAAQNDQGLRALLVAMLCPLFVLVANIALAALIGLSPRVYDPYLYRFDAALGFQASFITGVWFQHLAWLRNTCYLIYSAIPLAEAAAFALFLRSKTPCPRIQ